MNLQYRAEERKRREQQLSEGVRFITHIRPVPKRETRVGKEVCLQNGYHKNPMFATLYFYRDFSSQNTRFEYFN